MDRAELISFLVQVCLGVTAAGAWAFLCVTIGRTFSG